MTIRNWLNRFEKNPLEQALYDEKRSGRPRKPIEDEYKDLLDDFKKPPTEL